MTHFTRIQKLFLSEKLYKLLRLIATIVLAIVSVYCTFWVGMYIYAFIAYLMVYGTFSYVALSSAIFAALTSLGYAFFTIRLAFN